MKKKLDASYTQNRELSWLRFNERVLEEAADPTVPLFERFKFTAIFISNLDEFFMVRVGSLYQLSLLQDDTFDNKSFLKPSEQLDLIYNQVADMCVEKDRVFKSLQIKLEAEGIKQCTPKHGSRKQREFLQTYFQENVFPVLSPQIIDLHHPFPCLENKQLYIAVLLKRGKEQTLGIIGVPKNLSRLIIFSGQDLNYTLLEDLILYHVDDIFSMYTVIDKAVISVTRNADISPDDEAPEVGEDYLQHMRSTLRKRRSLAVVRLEVQSKGESMVADYLRKRISLKRYQTYKSAAPLDLSYVYNLADKLPAGKVHHLLYTPFAPAKDSPAAPGEKLIDYVQHNDMLLFYPYQSFDLFSQLVQEAANDDNVLSIRITIYRLGKHGAKLMNSLITAAELGKDVTVLMELKARFDEANNIFWAESLQEAGCHILYGFEGYKVHSKICHITRRVDGHMCSITQIGTGNYNPQTANFYTDLSLITSDDTIGRDADAFFKNMGMSNLKGKYEELLVAPYGLKHQLLRFVEKERDKALRGEESRIILKMNSLTDRDLIDALQEASAAGVPIYLIVRGISCLLPGVSGKTENIHIRSIVGRFLEHSRIYCFGADNDLTMYIASADWMTRNTEHRVEIACPVKDESIKKKIMHSLDIMLADNVKARLLRSDGSYSKLPSTEKKINSQEYFMEHWTER